MTKPDDAKIADTILRLCRARGSAKTICPSEAARELAPDGDWRTLMPDVRRIAGTLADRGVIAATQRGARVDIASARGPIRLQLTDDVA
jgi:hypothetical protein